MPKHKYTYYYVTSPAANGRQKNRMILEWGGCQKSSIYLADWSYGHNHHPNKRKAKAQARRAKALYPKRRFVIMQSTPFHLINIQEL